MMHTAQPQNNVGINTLPRCISGGPAIPIQWQAQGFIDLGAPYSHSQMSGQSAAPSGLLPTPFPTNMPLVGRGPLPSDISGGFSVGGHVPVLRTMTAPPVPQMQVQMVQLQQQERPRTSTGSGARFGSSLGAGVKGECEDQQCAEECDPDECGDENRAPLVDKGPILPILLSSTTIAGAVCMSLLQLPMLSALTRAGLVPFLFYVVYLVTLVCMAYASLCDPGQLKRDYRHKEYSSLRGGEKTEADEIEVGAVPKRAHKTWLYRLPIRRYDHYCRWLGNCIGLLNHREFILMCIGLLLISVLGAILDSILLVYLVRHPHAYPSQGWVTYVLMIVHLFYSVALGVLAAPILRLHIGFISRNELASEWKRNIFYVIQSSRTGEMVPVNELDDDEFNEEFDSFQYDRLRNPFDKGFTRNCMLFWCTARCSQSQLGEF